MIEKDLLYSKKPVIIADDGDRRSHSDNDGKKRTDNNLDRENKFVVQTDSKYMYSIGYH